MDTQDLSIVGMEIRILAAILVKFAKRDLERRLTQYGLEIGALPYDVMHMLRQRDRTISDLSQKTGISPASLVPVIDMLEQRGLVKRGQDPNDRRRTPLALTPLGRETLSSVPLVDKEDALAQCLANMGDEQAQQLLEQFRTLVAGMIKDESKVQNIAASLR
jgi:DNA-binding MarR family transcriptional regulator